MRAMILAAGRGMRMQELTETLPKPLLRIGDHYLIEYAIFSLIKNGIEEIVINICYRGEQIKAVLGNGERYGIKITYSEEKEVLETGGGIFKALPLLGPHPFIVVSGDIITDYPLKKLMLSEGALAHLILVDNPDYHPLGDFCLSQEKIHYGNSKTLTFGNIGLYHPALFAECKLEKFPLGTLLKEKIMAGKITGEHYCGRWYNVGTKKDLKELTDRLITP